MRGSGMIKILHKDGYWRPLVFCDVCGKIIEDGNMAGAAYIGADREKDGEIFEVVYFHKGQCHDEIEDRYGIGWEEMSTFFDQVLFNAKIKLPDREFHRVEV
jgi:hypothetical protein